jgi:hypothetical protein
LSSSWPQLVPPRNEPTGDLHSYLCPASFILEARVDEPGNIQSQPREVLSREEFWPPGESVKAALIKPHLSLLLTDIHSDGTLAKLAPWSDRTDEDRQRQARQIRNAVGRLHAAGVVWGNAKHENVLVGMAGDAWLVDFGGSYSRGLVDGVPQGLRRIDEWLERCSLKPVDRDHRTKGRRGAVVVGVVRCKAVFELWVPCCG